MDEPVLYDSRDLVTHAVCVGMTGSGKTGLCLGLIEEAAIDGVPVIAIDPKGDLGNLLLTFPRLSAAEFRPWINEDDARRAGVTEDEFAAQQAKTWAAGLAEWGQDGARVQRLREAAEFVIFTPGSRAGRPVSILSSFAAPSPAERDDVELLAERASGTATSALVLAGVDAPPRSREHSLLAALLTHAWRGGADLDLAALIRQVQSPPFDKVGVVDLESFFPSKERFELAMKLNGVLAAPGFETWLEGEPLDPQGLFYTPDGRPRVSVFSIAHLGDAERMFFVSLLMNQMVSWMRRQTGTTSLRALLYMDEILGYFPPVANPPSKPPLLTLLKQGRAFGLGVVLATQNPVDLDYKGLGNTGTWFLGRLQTERDKARVLDGLEGTGGGVDRAGMDRVLSALKKRVFLMHNVHDAEPTVFETRWTLSYLRGPLSRDQIKTLTASSRPAAPDVARPAAPARKASSEPEGAGGERPVVPPGIQEWFLRPEGEPVALYAPGVLGAARVSFSDRDAWRRHDHRPLLLRPHQRRCDSGGLGRGGTVGDRCGRSDLHARGRGAIRGAPGGGGAAQEVRRVGEVVQGVAGAERAHLAAASPEPGHHVTTRRIGARLPDPAPARSARRARRGGRGRAQEVRVEAGGADRAAAAGAAGGRARSPTGVRLQGADRLLDGGDRARGAVRTEGRRRSARWGAPRPRRAAWAAA